MGKRPGAPKPEEVEPVVCVCPVAVRGAEAVWVVVPGTAADDAATAIAADPWRAVGRRALVALVPAILRPLPDVAFRMAPRSWRAKAYREEIMATLHHPIRSVEDFGGQTVGEGFPELVGLTGIAFAAQQYGGRRFESGPSHAPILEPLCRARLAMMTGEIADAMQRLPRDPPSGGRGLFSTQQGDLDEHDILDR